jgi:hypothetical protein
MSSQGSVINAIPEVLISSHQSTLNARAEALILLISPD